MSGIQANRRPSGRTALALGLCFLAFFFALEAKMASYGIPVTLDGDVQAVKALPVDTPEVVSEGIPTPDPVHPYLSFAILASWVVVDLAAANILLGIRFPFRQYQPPSPAHFFPNIFFRPPPSA
jgi:uncharacterized membrane protein